MKDAYNNAAVRGKGIIISGVIAGRAKDKRLLDYISKHENDQVSIMSEIRGFMIVEEVRK